jgi:hypothetical protein
VSCWPEPGAALRLPLPPPDDAVQATTHAALHQYLASYRVRWAADKKSVNVEMKLRFWNRTYVGTHYGGSLNSMAYLFYMLMLMNNLGPAYILWDRGGLDPLPQSRQRQGTLPVSNH